MHTRTRHARSRSHRPHPPTPKTTKRLVWEYCHKILGRVACLLGIINPFWGIVHIRQARTLLMPVYSIWVGSLVLFWVVATVAGYPGDENPSPISKPFAKLRAARQGSGSADGQDDSGKAYGDAEGGVRRRNVETELTEIGSSSD